ncbi:TlpA family protein disulfide reductase [Virgibacillus ainsalahensis]
MYKKILGIVVLLVLGGIVVSEFIGENTDNQADSNPNEFNVTGDTDAEGGMIAPAESTGIEPGKQAPDFELETLDGDKLKLSELQGKKVILNFWATWCGPCRDEMPEMQEFYEEYGEEIEILAVNLTDTENKISDVSEYIDEFSFTYPILLDKGGTVSDEYKGAVAVPTTYFINTDGVVQAPKKTGPMTYEFMEETINSMD